MLDKVKAYLELTKPRLMLLALATTVSSFYIAHTGPWTFQVFFQYLHTVVGAALIGGSANALNQYLERIQDAQMKRTQLRPLPSGRLKEKQALRFGVTVSLVGMLELYFFVGRTASLIALILLLCYVLFYTPLKQKTTFNTFIGAGAGALPVLLGWTASSGTLNSRAWVLFFILFVWQLPHFSAISWTYREDYRRGGFRMMSLLDETGAKTAWSIVAYCLVLFALSLLPAVVGITGLTYLFLAIFFGCLLIGFALFIAVHEFTEAKKFIPISIIYLLVLNISMVIDKV